MLDSRTAAYADKLSLLIQKETVSFENEKDKRKFYEFQRILSETFPRVFETCEYEDFDGSFLLRWKGTGEGKPILLMNHHDVVEASGEWKYPAFSGAQAEGKIWGRGTLDTKGGLFAMLQAAEELLAEGYRPLCDIYFSSACNEETDGAGTDAISRALAERSLCFDLVLDEGGMILYEPIGGAKASYAMVGVGEKGCIDLKFTARSSGGHASVPPKNSPLVRLGRFMAEVERKKLFKVKLSSNVAAMLKSLSASMRGVTKFVLGHPRLFRPLLTILLPKISDTAGAMLKTTVASTMASGSEGSNVLPQEAYVVCNMRYSHHQGKDESVRAIKRVAEKYGLETEILDDGFDSPISDHRSDAFSLICRAVEANFSDVFVAPYVMTAASDCRYMSRVSKNCLRFSPFRITDEQLKSVHAANENLDLSALSPAVEFYKYVLKEGSHG